MKKIMSSVWNYLCKSWQMLASNLVGEPDDAEEEPGSHYFYH